MTMFGIFPVNSEGAIVQKPSAMFKDAGQAVTWAKTTYGERAEFKVKEIEITRCDVVERTGLVGR